MPIIGIIASAANVSVVYNFMVSGALATLSLSTDGITWDIKPQDFSFEYDSSVSDPGPFDKIHYVNSKYIGSNGYPQTSTDGITWTYQKSNTYGLFDVVYQNSQYVGVTNSQGYVGTSTDLVTWVPRTVPLTGPNSEVKSVAYGNSTYFVAGNPGATYSSTDGITWTSRTVDVSSAMYWNKVIYANNLFVVVGYDSTGGLNKAVIRTSTDAITWTTRTPANTGNNTILWDIAYGGGNYIAASDTVGAQVSTDGITWTLPTFGWTQANRFCVEYGNGTYALGDDTVDDYIWTSTNLTTWTSRGPLGITGTIKVQDIAYDGSKWMIGTGWDTVKTANLYTSTDLVTYTVRTTGPKNVAVQIEAQGYFNGVYIAAGSDGASDAPLYTSTDRVSWTLRTANFGTRGIGGCSYGASTYLIVGDGGKISTSTDAVTWTSRTSGTTSNLSSTIYAGSQFIAAGASGRLQTSTDGITWTARTSGFGALQINSLGYGASTYVAVGANGRITSSTDGVTWTSRTSQFGTTAIRAVNYGDKFVAAGGTPTKISTSTDGVTWTSRTPVLDSFFPSSVGWKDNLYVIVGNKSSTSGGDTEQRYGTSTDGITWTSRTMPISVNQSNYSIISL